MMTKFCHLTLRSFAHWQNLKVKIVSISEVMKKNLRWGILLLPPKKKNAPRVNPIKYGLFWTVQGRGNLKGPFLIGLT